jgi:hypothetical protein
LTQTSSDTASNAKTLPSLSNNLVIEEHPGTALGQQCAEPWLRVCVV